MLGRIKSILESSCPAEVPGIHEFSSKIKNVDGRDKPGHDSS
jgi:hypothetical protein